MSDFRQLSLSSPAVARRVSLQILLIGLLSQFIVDDDSHCVLAIENEDDEKVAVHIINDNIAQSYVSLRALLVRKPFSNLYHTKKCAEEDAIVALSGIAWFLILGNGCDILNNSQLNWFEHPYEHGHGRTKFYGISTRNNQNKHIHLK